jgi:hypothetical protein
MWLGYRKRIGIALKIITRIKDLRNLKGPKAGRKKKKLYG